MQQMKGVIITESNQQSLLIRYGFPDSDLDMFPVGHIMITDFGDNGDSRYNGVLTQTQFDSVYTKGEDLLNNFFEIHRK